MTLFEQVMNLETEVAELRAERDALREACHDYRQGLLGVCAALEDDGGFPASLSIIKALLKLHNATLAKPTLAKQAGGNA